MKKYLYLIFSLLILLFDQYLKYLAAQGTFSAGEILTYACNPHISWSIPLKGLLFWLLWLTAISGLIFYLRKNPRNIFILLVLSGAISNLYDRITAGCVIDYINLGFFPIFNLADAAITAGALSFLISQFKEKK
jgi:signal peptidase II